MYLQSIILNGISFNMEKQTELFYPQLNTFLLSNYLLYFQPYSDTRMHSSRMRTGRGSSRLLGGGDASCSGGCLLQGVSAPRGVPALGGCLLWGGACSGRGVSAPGGGYSWGGGCLLWRGVCSGGACSRRGGACHWGVASQHALWQTPLWTEWLTDRCKNIPVGCVLPAFVVLEEGEGSLESLLLEGGLLLLRGCRLRGVCL